MSSSAGRSTPGRAGAEDGGGPLRRVLPGDWPYALRAGVEPVVALWLVAVIPTIAVYLATSSLDAAAALSLGSAVHAGTGLWALSLGAPWGDPASANGAVGLPLLGLTVLGVLVTRWSVRRSRLSGGAAAAWTVLSAALAAALLVVLGAASTHRPWGAVLGAAALSAAVVAWDLASRGRSPRRASVAWSRRAPWVDPALRLARSTALAVGVLVLVVAVLALVDGGARLSRLHDALSGGGLVSSVGLVLLQLGWLPTALVWALSWLVGPGFTVGSGSLFAPDQVIAGSVPSLPLLGLLPTTPLGTVGLYVPLLISLAAMAAAWRERRRLRGLRLGEALIAAGAAALILALATALLCWAASGPIGPGRMRDVGPKTGYTTLLMLLESGVGLLAVAALSHPYVRALTSRGVLATARVTDAAADSARARVGAGVEAVRERRAEAGHARAEGADRAPGTVRTPSAAAPGAVPGRTGSHSSAHSPFAGWREAVPHRPLDGDDADNGDSTEIDGPGEPDDDEKE